MIVELTAAAEADLEAIGDYIARDNPVRAASFVRELYRSCLDIAEMPEAWPVFPVVNITEFAAGCMAVI